MHRQVLALEEQTPMEVHLNWKPKLRPILVATVSLSLFASVPSATATDFNDPVRLPEQTGQSEGFRNCPASDAECGDKALARLFGRWHGAGKAAESIYGTLTISADYLGWGGGRIPICKTRYAIVGRYAGSTYPDQPSYFKDRQRQRAYVAFRLRVLDRNCAKTDEILQLAVADDSDSVDVVTYSTLPTFHSSGWMLFVKDQ